MKVTRFYRDMVDTKEFRVAMEVTYWLRKKAEEDAGVARIFETWYRDLEMSALAYTIYKSGAEDIKAAVDNYEFLDLDQARDMNDDMICWLGVTAGEYFGLPDSKEKMEIIRECLVEFAEDTSVGYLSEIFERRGYEVV